MNPLPSPHGHRNSMFMHSSLPQLTSTPFISAEQMTDAENGKRHHENRFDLQTPGNDVLKTPRPADHRAKA